MKIVPEERRTIRVNVNGVDYERQVEPRLTLADFLRHELRLTGTHVGCEHGVCGACTILFDAAPVRSCIMYAVQTNGHTIRTVEDLAGSEDELHPVQQAFWEHGGLQCGFCTPGFLITATDLLARNPHPTEQEVRQALSGNLCRCTGYQSIVTAVMDAADRLQTQNTAQPDTAARQDRSEIT